MHSLFIYITKEKEADPQQFAPITAGMVISKFIMTPSGITSLRRSLK